MEDNKFYTTKQASDILGLTEYTIRKKIRNGEIKAIEGASVREGYQIFKDSVMDYAKKNRIALKIPAIAAGAATGAAVAAFVPVVGVAAVGAAMGFLFRDKKQDDEQLSKVNNEQLYDLSIKRLKTEIEGIDLKIKALELEEDNSKECQKQILKLEIQKNDLKGKIQELEIQRVMDNNLVK